MELFFNFSEESFGGKGFRNIGISAQGQAFADLDLAAFRREHDYFHVLPGRGLANALAEVKAIHTRQHDIEQNQIGRKFGDFGQGFIAAAGNIDEIAGLFH